VRDIPTDLLREEAQPVPPPAREEAPPEPQRMEPEPVEAVRFSTYYPKEVTPGSWQPLLAYAFRERAAAAVDGDAGERLGPRADDYRQTGDEARQPIVEGALITATPRLEGFQFNPPSVALGFFEDWHRFEFKLRATSAPLNQATNGQLTFTVEGVIVADLPLSIFVGETVAASSTASASRKAYDAIFCSYSRKDMEIVQRVERAYTILGLEYLRDMLSIRSGEDWSHALEKLIERADIFQLFWSSTSATSKHVEMEWRYALKLPNKPDNFIRPVYWEQPMPPVPEPLQHLHFAFDDTLDDE
ncbi:MAG: toll/interleukin-1 receptor domain-containing protein, partial [Sphingomonadaceae bacterium]|nr:toll/interleukin-1 receptor domain-containing protein [Sphingomonadaceae bacterium]